MKRSLLHSVSLCVCVLSLIGFAVSAGAGLVTADPSLPPTTGVYMTPADVHITYSGPGFSVVLSNVRHSGFTGITRINIPPSDEQESFNSVFDGLASVNGSPATPIQGTGPVRTLIHDKLGTTGTFQTEMLQLDLSGSTAFGPAMIRESPTRASLGETTVADIGGGLYQIDSFFDIFTELSIDGGQTWIPSQGSSRVILVPEPAGLALAGFAALTLLTRRRRI